MTLAPIELLVSSRTAEPVPVVRGEVLVNADAEQLERARAELRELGFTDEEHDDDRARTAGCPGTTRFRPRPDRPAPKLASALRRLAELDIPSAPHHVAALRGDMKSADGPEYTDNPPQWGKLLGGGGDHGDGAFVVVIDTGLDPRAVAGTRTADQWLQDMGDSDIDPISVFDEETGAVGSDGFIDGGAGHGTFVAGVIRQIAPNATVRVLRALDTRGIGSECEIAHAIRRAGELFETETAGRGVLNLSLGIQTANGLPPFALEQALQGLPDDVLVVAAAGNVQLDEPIWPAWSKRAIGVGALSRNGAGNLVPAPWSNSGHHVDFSAVGDGVSSTYIQGAESPDRDPDPEQFPRRDPAQDESYALWSGTSFSAPKVAGLLAKLLVEKADERDAAAAAVQALRDGRPYLPGYGYLIDC